MPQKSTKEENYFVPVYSSKDTRKMFLELAKDSLIVERLNSEFKELLKRRLILEEEIRNDVTVISDDFSALLSVLEKPRVQKERAVLRATKPSVKKVASSKVGVSSEVESIEKQLRELESKLNSI
jgi:hypothetical protein